MLAQFQSLYPTGSLISELVQIDRGKYIVRASVQIDGVTRATGMAAAETIEAAEDQARSRALMVILTTSQPSVAPPSPELVTQMQPNRSLSTTSRFDSESTYAATSNPVSPTEITPPSTPTAASRVKTDGYTPGISQSLTGTAKPETQLETLVENAGVMSGSHSENQSSPEIASSNVTPFPQRSYSSIPQEDVEIQSAPTTKKKKKAEPVDQSDDIAKIGVEMQRLGWTTEQGRDYLIKTYGKRSRHLLDPEELRQFRMYLESQPTPVDPLAGF
ncbi:MAG: hypothetical protein N2235_03260 [Fischerella sp.]|nr:hypothetical protein [Fischerella sp.]